MTTVIANSAVVVWAVVLIYAPAVLAATFRPIGPMAVAGGGMLTMSVVAVVTVIVSLTGHSPVPLLRVLTVLLLAALVSAAARGVVRLGSRRRSTRPRVLRPGSTALVVASAVLLGLWLLLPVLVITHRQGLDFGLLTFGNADQSNYVMAAQNVADSGFRDSHHIANVDMGTLSRENYVGSIALPVLLSAMTPLSPMQVALAAMAVALTLAAVGLWALSTEIWPSVSPALGLPCVVLATGSGLAVYSYSEYFLGAEVGLACVSATVAGAISLTRGWSWSAVLGVAAGGGYGVYAYGHIQLPVLALTPVVVAVAAGVLCGVRAVPRAVLRSVICVGAALVVSLPTLVQSYRLMRAQANAAAGWSLPPLSSVQALFWPQGIGLASSSTFVIMSWVAVAVVVAGALGVAWARRTERRSAVLAGLFVVGVAVVLLGSVHLYGGDRYQTWKMMQFLLPIALVASLPAVGLVTVRSAKVGASALSAAAGVALLGPWLLWSSNLTSPNPIVLSTGDLAAAAHDTERMDIVAINVRLADPNQTMMAGAFLDHAAVVLTQNSYYAPLASVRTCTLTTKALLDPGETDYVPLQGDFVLLQRPASCLTTR